MSMSIGSMKKASWLITLLTLTLLLSSCFQKLEVTPEEVVSEINAKLIAGDEKEKIEAYFKNKDLDSSFDNYAQRYQSIIRHPESGFHAIVIYIYVDENQSFIRAEVNDSYTFL